MCLLNRLAISNFVFTSHLFSDGIIFIYVIKKNTYEIKKNIFIATVNFHIKRVTNYLSKLI